MIRIFSTVVILAVIGIFFWPDIKPMLENQNQQVTLDSLGEVGSSVTLAASDAVAKAGSMLEEAGSDIADQLDLQGEQLKAQSITVLNNMGTSPSEVAKRIGEVVSQAVENVQGIITVKGDDLALVDKSQTNPALIKESLSAPVQGRARLADLVGTSEMIRGSDAPAKGVVTKVESQALENVQPIIEIPAPAALAPIPTKRFNTTLDFRPKTAILSYEARKAIDQIILDLQRPSSAIVTVIGQELANDKQMAFRRTQSLANYFRNKGIRAQALGVDGNSQLAQNQSANPKQSFEIVVKY